GELVVAMDAVLDNTVSATRHVTGLSKELSTNTTNAVGGVPVQKIGRQLIEPVATSVDDVRQQTDDITGYVAGRCTATEILQRVPALDDQRTAYVMKRQRESTGPVP